MEVTRIPHLTEAESLLLAVITFFVYLPEVPFMTGHMTDFFGCELTSLLMIIYFVGSMMVTVEKDLANGLLHAFSAALGWVTNHLVCAPAGETDMVLKDLVLLAKK